MQDAFTAIAQSAEPFVVNIKAEHALTSADLGGQDGGKEFKPPQGSTPNTPDTPGPTPFPRRAMATGSGVIVSPDGYILTNDHVVNGCTDVTVTLSDGREFPGKVAEDFRSDLATVKINPGAAHLTVAQFADSDSVAPGQWAMAIGSPFDLQNTVTVGIVSATKRHQTIGEAPTSERYYPDLIQTDAAINPGNSGGPLIDIDGHVIGINVAIESPVDGSSGVGFAIPSKIAQHILHQLIQNGKVVRGYLGLAPEDLSPARQTSTGVPAGAWVREVNLDSPAGKAGVHAGDVVTAFNGQAVDSELSLRDAISDSAPGAKIAMTIVRDGKPVTVSATVGAPPSDETKLPPAPTAPKVGVSLKTLASSDRSSLGMDSSVNGALVASVAPNSPAEEAGLETNDVIERVGNKHVASAQDAEEGKLSESVLDLHI
jgi:serine protease Do